MRDIPRTVIEIIDVSDDPDVALHKPDHAGVYINGQKVVVARNGIKIEGGYDDSVVTVTLTLQPTELHLERCLTPKETHA